MAKRKDSDDIGLDGGDLGLGRGLKPGAIPKDESDSESEIPQLNRTVVRVEKIMYGRSAAAYNTPNRSRSNSCCADNESGSAGTGQQGHQPKVPISEKLRNFKKSKSLSVDSGQENIPVTIYAEVPLGTSARQQRNLFEHELQEIFQQKGFLVGEVNHQDQHHDPVPNQKLDSKVLHKKLQQTQAEVDVLKQDLELCQRQLRAKYQAIKILQSQLEEPLEKRAFAVQHKQTTSNQKTKLLNNALQKEINRLQFEISRQEGYTSDSQMLWSERFDRACQENQALMATLEARSSEMRKSHAEKMALARERDELLVLLDLQERQRFEALRPASCEEDLPYNEFTSHELAILGACHCRYKDPEPCTCAHKAVYLQRDVGKLKEQLAKESQLKEEALITADAYRMAFEEQLARSRAVLKKLAEVTALSTENRMSNHRNRVQTAKAAFKWMIEQLNDDSPPSHSQPHTPEKVSTPAPASSLDCTSRVETEDTLVPTQNGESENGASSSEEVKNPENVERKQVSVDGVTLITGQSADSDLIIMLVDMISDKCEALAHQRLAARMLANKNKELEEKLSSLQEEVFLPSHHGNGVKNDHSTAGLHGNVSHQP